MHFHKFATGDGYNLTSGWTAFCYFAVPVVLQLEPKLIARKSDLCTLVRTRDFASSPMVKTPLLETALVQSLVGELGSYICAVSPKNKNF